jgi:ATP-binding cassette, subfamily C (CFTR/MRP), member 1
LIAAGAQYVVAIVPFSAIALYFLAKYYLRTSRQMRYLDLEAKSPLYTHFTETLNGIETIRAFNWNKSLFEETLRLTDNSQKPFYLMYCIQRWLNVVLDLFIAGIAVVLVAFAVRFQHTTSNGAIGVALVNLIHFNMELSELIGSWTDLETALGAIARLRSFLIKAPKEDATSESKKLPQSWPTAGQVVFDNVSAAYK